MAANGGGGLPFINHEEEEEEEEEEIKKKKNIKSGISIAERRAAKCGFNVSNINEGSGLVRSPYFTIPPGISPSALLDSPIMLPNSQAQLSPTTGTFQFPTPNPESLNLKLKLISTNQTDQSSSNTNFMKIENKLFEDFEYQNMQDNFEDGVGKTEVLVQPNSSKEKHPKETSEDGYFWRKYGQKHVKGSEFPRSYYKCTNTNCPMKKKVERSHDGQITEIVYKGSHNHSKPDQSFKRFGETSSTGKLEDIDVTSSTSLFNPLSTTFEHVESQDQFSSTFNNDQDEASLESISINDEDDNNGEYYEPKRRKKDSFPNEIANPRSTREPRVVVQIESDIDILDDGYRWRKYGQKVVKGNPNPRSYYKCTTPGCPVRKHVERAANDIKSVITTYEGKHNHEVPCSKGGGSLVISSSSDVPPNVTNSMSTPSPITQKQDATKPLYMERKPPLLNYNELMMRSNLAAGDFNFGAYPLSFPPFQYGSLMMNGNHNHMKRYHPSSNLYPMLPDYMSMNPGSAAAANVPGNFHFGNHSTVLPNSNSVRGQLEIRSECQSRNKEEKRDVYDGYPNHGNGTM